MTNGTIIVTGGAGFIGSNCVKCLNDQGIDQIVIVDALRDGIKWRNLVGKKYRELLLKDQLFDWLERGHADEVSAVIHLGACSSTIESDADYLHTNNTQYSQRLAEIAIKRGWRFIYASSAATYGDGNLGFNDSHELLQTLRPMNMYGYSKHAFDLWLQRNGYLDCTVGLKYFNVYGPNEWHKGRMSSHVLKMVPQALNGEIRLFKSNDPNFADGGQCRDFIYVKDAAEMTCAFLKNSDLHGIFNVGLGVAHTWNDLAHAVMQAVDKEVQIEYIEMPADLHKQYQNYTCADMSKWRTFPQLPQPSLDLNASVKDYVVNHILADSYH